MPKRKAQKKIDRYREKIRRLEEGEQRKFRRIIYSDSSDEDKNSDDNVPEDTGKADEAEVESSENEQADNAGVADKTDSAEINDPLLKADDSQKSDDLPVLEREILNALGESTEEGPKFGPKVYDNLARLWTPILRKGLGSKEAKDKIIKPYLIPENCPLLQAPKLNPEISAALSDASRFRDKRVESVQQQLGHGITAINRALSLLIESDANKLEAIKLLSDSCRILCDLHHGETQARKKFITPGLDKSFLNVIQDVDHDDTLFGNKLSEKIKASKVIEKQGLQIKKPAPIPKPSTSQSAPSRPRSTLNWTGPRYAPNRGGRAPGRARKMTPAGSTGRRAPSANQAKSYPSKNHRAPTQRQ